MHDVDVGRLDAADAARREEPGELVEGGELERRLDLVQGVAVGGLSWSCQ